MLRSPANALILRLILLSALAPVRVAADQPQGQVLPPASDKALHALAGASCALLAASALYPLFDGSRTPQDALRDSLGLSAAALGAATLAGIVKEVLDLYGWGNPEWADLLSTLLGGLAASAGVLAFSYLSQSEGASPENLPFAFACLGVVLSLPVAEGWIKARPARRNSASSG